MAEGQEGISGTRRTQAERRADTRRKLLSATIQSLVDVGYVATTTRRVARLAGVSQGAQTHYFPRRVDLVAAAVEDLAERRVTDLRTAHRSLPTSHRMRLAALLDVIWEDFSGDAFSVFVKLWVAAADEPELYVRLVDAEYTISRAISDLAVELAGDMTSQPGWRGRLQLMFAAVRGTALSERFEPEGSGRRELWPSVRAALLEDWSSWSS